MSLSSVPFSDSVRSCRAPGKIIFATASLAALVGMMGCSTPGIAVNGRPASTNELVVLPQRTSLFGSGFFGSSNPVVPQQQVQRSSSGQAAPPSEERLLAIARLFMAQGRTQEAQKIYQQLGRPPEPVQMALSTAKPAPQPRTLEKPPSTSPRQSTAEFDRESRADRDETKPAVAEKTAERPKATIRNNGVNEAPESLPEGAASPSAGSRMVSAEESHAGRSKDGLAASTVSTVTSEVETTTESVSSKSASAGDSPGWRVTSGFTTSKQGLATSAAPHANRSNQVGTTPATEVSPAWQTSPSVSSDPHEQTFELPARSVDASRSAPPEHIYPGRFLEPVVRNAHQPSTTQIPTPTAGSSPSPPASARPEAEPVTGNESDETTESPDGSPTLLIIPNGSHAAEKLARVKKAIRSEIKSANKNSTDPADLLLSGPFRDMHSAPVLESAKLLSEADPKRRAQAAQQLGLAGTEARTVLPLLRDRLNKEQDKTVRVRLAEAIVKVVPDDTAAVAELTKLLVDPEDWKVRQLAAAGLAAAAGGNNTQAVTMLTAAMNDGHPRVRTMVALTLGTFGPKAKAALPRLQFATSSDIPRVQEAAQAAIVCIAAETAPKSTIGNADGNDLESEPQLEQIPAGEIRTEQLENSPEKTAVDGSDPFAGTVFDFDSLDAASTQSPSH